MTVFCVLAHREPELLARLAVRLAPHPVLVHVDRKTAIGPFVEACRGLGHVRFLPDRARHRVHWGGYSQVVATEELFAAAVRTAGPDERLVVLSGQDYPLRPVAEIDRLLTAGPPLRIRYCVLDETTALGREFQTRVLHTGLVVPGGSSRILAISWVARRLTRHLQPAVERLFTPRRRPLPPGYVFATGSAYLVLTPVVLAELTALRTPEFDQVMRTAFASDEKHYHSLAATSRWAQVVYPDGPDRVEDFLTDRLEIVHALLQGSKPVWVEADLPALLASGRLFARKVSLATSGRLLDRLDALHGATV